MTAPHVHTPPAPLHTCSFTNMNFQIIWSRISYCLRNTIFGTCEPCRFSIVPLPGKVTSAGFKSSQFECESPIYYRRDISNSFALYWMATLQNLIFRLGASSDLVIHSSGAYIETDSYEENKSLWQNKKSLCNLSFINSDWLMKMGVLDSCPGPDALEIP